MSKPIDKVVLLGKRKSMVGIATQPVVAPETDKPAVIILNTGIIHRVGHNRMYVALSRELADMGHSVLRFDLSGLGDSETRSDIVDPLAASLADVQEAVDWLCSSRGAKSVVLIGLCSGADLSIAYAGRDPRIVGAVLLDPTIPRTPRYYFNDFSARLMRGQNWKNVVQGRGRLWKLFAKRSTEAPAEDWSPWQLSLQDPLVRSFLESAYHKAVQGKNQLLAIFTAGLEYQHNYRRQLVDAMRKVPFGAQLKLEYFARCDHTFTFASDRQRLFEMVKTWLRTTNFVEPASQPPSGS